MDSEAEWITHDEAAALAKVSRSTLGYAIAAGKIRRRSSLNHTRPMLSRASVLAFKAQRLARYEARVSRAAQREQAAKPPDTDHVWLRVPVVAVLLDVTPERVRQLAAAEKLPATRHEDRWWFRRDLIEAAAARRQRQPPTG